MGKKWLNNVMSKILNCFKKLRSKKLSKLEALFDLFVLSQEQFNLDVIVIAGKKFKTERNQVITSTNVLCKRWGWSNIMTVSRALDEFESLNYIERVKTNKGSIIKLVNNLF